MARVRVSECDRPRNSVDSGRSGSAARSSPGKATHFHEDPMAETGQRVGDYEVLAPLGVGGMGSVYKVRNVISNREEAMKILLPDFASDPELAARFMAE